MTFAFALLGVLAGSWLVWGMPYSWATAVGWLTLILGIALIAKERGATPQ